MNRKEALEWWAKLPIKEKEHWVRICLPYYRKYHFVSSSDIESIYDIFMEDVKEKARKIINENYKLTHVSYDDLINSFVLGYINN